MMAPGSPGASPATFGASAAATLRWLWHELRISVPVIVAVAAFLSTMFDEPFARSLVDSFCVGLLIQALIEGGRYAMAHRLRRRAPDDFGARHNWPGWRAMGPWIVVSSVLGFVAGRALGDLLTGAQRTPGYLLTHPRALLLIVVVILVASVGSVYFFYARGRMAAMEARNEAALRSAAESQLKLLVSQLEPHMLFNTLANLRVLIGLDPSRAQAMLDRLIGFLRATLEVSRLGTHSLASEFARVGDYLDLMQVRMGPRLQVRLHCAPELAEMPVAPLLLQPLVENAIKHGLEPRLDGGSIDVSAARDGDALVLTVRDDGAGLPKAPGAGSGGFGTLQVRERLATLYGAAGTLTLRAAADGARGTVATVRMPMPATAPARVPASPCE
jgi:signal transduction histidine kinase